MPIDSGLRDKLVAGTILVAIYKGKEYRATVIADAEGKTRFRLQDGQEFKSPSAAGSAVMGGTACNGWRFWSLEGETTAAAATPTPAKKARPGRKPEADAEPEAAETALDEPETPAD